MFSVISVAMFSKYPFCYGFSVVSNGLDVVSVGLNLICVADILKLPLTIIAVVSRDRWGKAPRVQDRSELFLVWFQCIQQAQAQKGGLYTIIS